MVMTRVLAVRSGGCNAHVPQTEIDLQFCRHGRSVFEIDEIDLGTRGRRRGTSGALTLRKGSAAGYDGDEQRRDHVTREPAGFACDLLEHVHVYTTPWLSPHHRTELRTASPIYARLAGLKSALHPRSASLSARRTRAGRGRGLVERSSAIGRPNTLQSGGSSAPPVVQKWHSV